MMLSNKTLLLTLLIVDSLKYIRVHRSSRGTLQLNWKSLRLTLLMSIAFQNLIMIMMFVGCEMVFLLVLLYEEDFSTSREIHFWF